MKQSKDKMTPGEFFKSIRYILDWAPPVIIGAIMLGLCAYGTVSMVKEHKQANTPATVVSNEIKDGYVFNSKGEVVISPLIGRYELITTIKAADGKSYTIAVNKDVLEYYAALDKAKGKEKSEHTISFERQQNLQAGDNLIVDLRRLRSQDYNSPEIIRRINGQKVKMK